MSLTTNAPKRRIIAAILSIVPRFYNIYNITTAAATMIDYRDLFQCSIKCVKCRDGGAYYIDQCMHVMFVCSKKFRLLLLRTKNESSKSLGCMEHENRMVLN